MSIQPGGGPHGPPAGQTWTPVPDPTALTDAAIARATSQFRRELDGIRELLAERIATEAAARDMAVAALRELGERRINDLDRSTDKRIGLISLTPEQVRADRDRDLHGLRDALEARIDGMDKASELLAVAVAKVPTETDKAITALRQVLEARIDAMDKATALLATNVGGIPAEIDRAATSLRAVMETRLAGMDEATKLLATNVDKVPYAILQEAGNLKAFIMSRIEDVSHVSDQRFAAVNAQFASNALALEAALTAQKDAAAAQNESNTLAIAKSEQATKETIAANAAASASSIAGLSATIADLKDRLVRLEAGGVATSASHHEQREVRGEAREGFNQRLVAVGVTISLIAIVVNVLIVVFTHK